MSGSDVFRWEVSVTEHKLGGFLTVPENAVGLVLFVHGSGSSRFSPRNTMVAEWLNGAGVATLLFDLLTEAETSDRANVFNIDLLAARLATVTDWIRGDARIAKLPIGYFGSSTGGGAALVAAAEMDARVAAVVSRGGRPDLAPKAALNRVRAPTLLIVGSRDDAVLDLNRKALAELRCEARLEIVDGATHLFEEPGCLEHVCELATAWFVKHFDAAARP